MIVTIFVVAIFFEKKSYLIVYGKRAAGDMAFAARWRYRMKKTKRKLLRCLVPALALCLLLGGCGEEKTVQLELNSAQTPLVLEIPERQKVPENPYAQADFTQDGEFIRYTGTQADTQQWIDVSYYQGEIDWNAVKQAGIEFAILRVGFRGWSGDGSYNEDPLFRQNLEQAQAAGLQVGVYFFSQAITPEEAYAEGEYACTLLAGVALDLPVYFDWEQLDEPDARTAGMHEQDLTNFFLAFSAALQNVGYKAGLYFYTSLGQHNYDLGLLQDFDLWQAEPGNAPEFSSGFTMWQYSYTATLPGIAQPVDLNLRFVSKA